MWHSSLYLVSHPHLELQQFTSIIEYYITMAAAEHTHKISFAAVLLGLVGLSLVYIVALAISRLYLSPLAQFPGPRLAALTKWYEFYYEVVLNGKFTFEIRRMHEMYGRLPRSSLHHPVGCRYTPTLIPAGQAPLSELPRMNFTSTISLSGTRFMQITPSQKSIVG
jgi:hypothetical protein